MTVRTSFRGSFTALVTPFTENGKAKLNEAYANIKLYYEQNGEKGLEDYARTELKRCADRVRQITKAFVLQDFSGFARDRTTSRVPTAAISGRQVNAATSVTTAATLFFFAMRLAAQMDTAATAAFVATNAAGLLVSRPIAGLPSIAPALRARYVE